MFFFSGFVKGKNDFPGNISIFCGIISVWLSVIGVFDAKSTCIPFLQTDGKQPAHLSDRKKDKLFTKQCGHLSVSFSGGSDESLSSLFQGVIGTTGQNGFRGDPVKSLAILCSVVSHNNMIWCVMYPTNSSSIGPEGGWWRQGGFWT